MRSVVLSVPTYTEEVSKDLPTIIVSSCQELNTAEYIQNLFVNTCLRVYKNSDIYGVELCGALKNIISLAKVISEGLRYGDNAKATLITCSMTKIIRLGVVMERMK